MWGHWKLHRPCQFPLLPLSLVDGRWCLLVSLTFQLGKSEVRPCSWLVKAGTWHYFVRQCAPCPMIQSNLIPQEILKLIISDGKFTSDVEMLQWMIYLRIFPLDVVDNPIQQRESWAVRGTVGQLRSTLTALIPSHFLVLLVMGLSLKNSHSWPFKPSLSGSGIFCIFFPGCIFSQTFPECVALPLSISHISP